MKELGLTVSDLKKTKTLNNFKFEHPTLPNVGKVSQLDLPKLIEGYLKLQQTTNHSFTDREKSDLADFKLRKQRHMLN